MGSLLLGLYVANWVSRLVGNVSRAVVITANGGLGQSLSDIRCAIMATVLLLGGYAVAIGLRYFGVVAPYKRSLRQKGLIVPTFKVGWYDHVLDRCSFFCRRMRAT